MDETASMRDPPTLVIEGPWDWDQIAGAANRQSLATALAKAVANRRWFGAKSRAVESLDVVDAIAVSRAVRVLLAKFNFLTGPSEIYQVPLGFADSESAGRLPENRPELIRVESSDGRLIGVLYDPLSEAEFCGQLLELFESSRTLHGAVGEMVAMQTSAFDTLRGGRREVLIPRPLEVEQSNSSVIYGARLILKVFRKVEMGRNPDIEICDYLTRRQFANVPRLAGSLNYRQADTEPRALAILQELVPNQGDAWKFTLDWLARCLSAEDAAALAPSAPPEGICLAAQHAISTEARAAFGGFLSRARLLGTRTAELHLMLAANAGDPAFAPEPFSELDRRKFFERSSNDATETFALLNEHLAHLPRELASKFEGVSSLEATALDRYFRLASGSASVAKIRCHGDYHLGQVLVTDDDFMIIDFEGEPARPVSERREKQLAMRDVAGMIRSLHYASCSAAATARTHQTATDRVATWTRAWYAWSSVAFLAGYLEAASGAVFLPPTIDEFARLLDGCLLEKALYELRYELNNRPDWVHLPLEALTHLLDGGGPGV